MIPFGIAPQLLRRGALFIKNRLEEGFRDNPQPTRSEPFDPTRQGQQTTVEIGPETAQRWQQAILKNSKIDFGKIGQIPQPPNTNTTMIVTPTDPELGTYQITKTTEAARNVPGGRVPSQSDIAFTHSEPGGMRYVGNHNAPDRRNPHIPGTKEHIRFEYMKRLQNAGLKAALGRQISDVRVGSDISATLYVGDGRTSGRRALYTRATNGALSFPDGALGANARRVGRTNWASLYGDGTLSGLEQLNNMNRDIHAANDTLRGLGQRPNPPDFKPVNPKANEYGIVSFDPNQLKKPLKDMAGEYLVKQAVKWGARRINPYVSGYMEVSDMYKGLTGRSLEKDINQNFGQGYKPVVEQLMEGDATYGTNLRF